MNNITLISVDLGKTGGMALWRDNLCVDVTAWSIGKKELEVEHLADIVKYFNDVISKYRPEVSVERPGRSLSHQWVLYSDLRTITERNKCKFYAYFPQTIKKTTIGHGRASKEEMEEAVLKYKILDSNVKPAGEHLHDCLGVGICHLIKTNKIMPTYELIPVIKKVRKTKETHVDSREKVKK